MWQDLGHTLTRKARPLYAGEDLGKTLTVPRYGGVLVGPSFLRQVFNDTESEVLHWLRRQRQVG